MKKGIIVGVAVTAVICAAVLPRFMGNQQFAKMHDLSSLLCSKYMI